MKLTLVQGATHETPHIYVSTAHTVRIRLGVGIGAEAFDNQALRETIWPAGAVEYLPPEVEHRHTTLVDADWLSVEIEHSEWLELLDQSALASGLLTCDAGYRYVNSGQLIQSAYRLMTLQGQDAAILREEIGLSLLRSYHAATQTAMMRKKQASLSNVAIKKLANFVEDHLNDNVGLSEIAREAKLSRFHFTSAFKRATGSTPYQYLLSRRLIRTQKMLRNTVKPITTIALDCGFSSHAHLTAAFSQRFGMPPMAYRKAERQR